MSETHRQLFKCECFLMFCVELFVRQNEAFQDATMGSLFMFLPNKVQKVTGRLTDQENNW